MTNLLVVVPDFDLQNYSHIVPSLERALISTADLLTLEPLEIAKKAQVPIEEVRKLVATLLPRLKCRTDTGLNPVSGLAMHEHGMISLLDDELDATMNGGIHTGYLSEIAGESAAGKTQCLMTLLLSAQLKNASGNRKNALYISTEAPLPTQRLAQILDSHPKLQALPEDERPSLSNIQSTRVSSLETQEHILRFQVPVIVQRHNIGLVVIDSIAANYRAEFDKFQSKRSAEAMAKRSLQIAKLASHLRDLARIHNIAIVVANQVADRFDSFGAGLNQLTQRITAASPLRIRPAPALSPDVPDVTPTQPSTDDPLSLDHQQKFFSGWGDGAAGSSKNPSLGLTWTNFLAARIVLLKEPIYDEAIGEPGEDKNVIGWNRDLKVVFSSWCACGTSRFEIWQGGIRSPLEETAA